MPLTVLFIAIFIFVGLVVGNSLPILLPQWVAENDGNFGGLTITAAVVVAVVTVMLVESNKTPQFTYNIHIRMANGDETVLPCQNREDQREALKAINKAIAG